MKRIVFISLAVCILFTACKKGPTTPTTPSPTAQGIIVNSSSDMLYIGISETFTATVTMSDGTSKAVTAGVWGGDNPSVATVEGTTGRVTIVGSGMVTIFVDYGGKRGTKLIRGLPNYQGTWSGSYYIVSCSNSGYFSSSGFCNTFSVNLVFPTDLNLIQNRDAVQGTFYLGTLSAPASGPIQTDGTLLLAGAVQSGIITIDVSWSLQSTIPGRCTGSLSQLWRAAGYSGDGRIAANIRDLNRTSNLPLGFVRGAPLLRPTLQQLIYALTRR